MTRPALKKDGAPVGRCYFARRETDGMYLFGWTRDLVTRMCKTEYATPGRYIYVASMRCSEAGSREVLRILRDGREEGKFLSPTPVVEAYIHAIRAANAFSSSYEDRLPPLVLLPHQAHAALAPYGVTASTLRKHALPGRDVFYTDGRHLRYTQAYVNEVESQQVHRGGLVPPINM